MFRVGDKVFVKTRRGKVFMTIAEAPPERMNLSNYEGQVFAIIDGWSIGFWYEEKTLHSATGITPQAYFLDFA